MKKIKIVMFIFIIFDFSALYAQGDKINGMPPAQVVVAEVNTGTVAPENEFIGTIYYQEVSDVASEVNGLVEAVNFEEGQRVNKNDILVKLGAELLEKTLQATRASYEQVVSDIEKAKRELERAESLYKEDLISEQMYDDRRFNVRGLEKKGDSLKAEVERLETEFQKKVIKAPFKGVVVKKHIDRGEWLSPGLTVATIARDNLVDIIVDVPERVVMYIKQGMAVDITVGEKQIKGKVFAIIPKGDISTRTIPVKIRVKNNLSLIEGMGAGVSLPVGKKEETFIVPRDAVIPVFGNPVVFAVIDSKAMMIPIKVVGYQGMNAGVHADGIKEGMKVVVKGNERLRDEQPVKIIDKSQTPSTK